MFVNTLESTEGPVLEKIPREESKIQRRLEKLVRTYDSITMKIFITIECLGEGMANSVYSRHRKIFWEQFLERREACRLDVNWLQKFQLNYNSYLNISREEQGKDFHQTLLRHLRSKGAVDCFKQITPGDNITSNGKTSFMQHMVRKFDKKLDAWFETFEAVAVTLSGHVKVSNFVRILSGNIDVFARRTGHTYIVDIKTTSDDVPRPMDIIHLCLLKMLAIQNGLEDPNNVRLALLILHVSDSRPILRLWEYDPTVDMERAIREADIDKLIDAGTRSENHEFYKGNVTLLDDRTNQS